MSAVLDTPSVRRFTDDLRADATRCGNGEGTECRTLEAKIGRFVALCGQLRAAVNGWAMSVFRGETEADAEAEKLYHGAVVSLLDQAKRVAEGGERFAAQCYHLEGLEDLKWRVRDLEYLVANWRTPKLAVAPGPRVRPSAEATAEILRNIAALPAPVADWQPSTAEQREFLEKHPAGDERRDG